MAAQSARSVQKSAGTGKFAPYQAIILGEFVAAELLVAITPIATRPNTPGLSPYIPRDLSKMAAIGVTYFLLSLLSVGGRGAGRFGAWFGGLILITVGLATGADVVRDLDLLAGIPFTQRKGGGESAGGGGQGGLGKDEEGSG